MPVLKAGTPQRHAGVKDVNCPKCGYEQEERLDCRKCGIVFSKYLALYPPNKNNAPENTDQAPQPGASENGYSELSELQRNVRDLNRRYSEVEFERAERHRLRDELHELGEKIQNAETAGSSRLADLEERLGQLASIGAATEGLAGDLYSKMLQQIDPVFKRIEQIEARLETDLGERASKQDPQYSEILRELEQRFVDLESKVARRAEEAKAAAESLAKDLSEVRGALQNVTLRYSEIGELKKNHLLLLDKVDNLRLELETAKEGVSEPASEKAQEIEMEVLALRAEVRHVLKAVEGLSAAPESADEASSMRSGIEMCTGRIMDLTADLTALKTHTNEIQEQLHLLQEQLETLIEIEPESDSSLQEPHFPVEQEVHEIRESLAEIRTFMNTLSKRL